MLDTIATKILGGEFAEGATITVDAKDGELTFKQAKAKVLAAA